MVEEGMPIPLGIMQFPEQFPEQVEEAGKKLRC